MGFEVRGSGFRVQEIRRGGAGARRHGGTKALRRGGQAVKHPGAGYDERVRGVAMTIESAPATTGESARKEKKLRVKLGEELPIFCERCGYSLYGLPQSRCERCGILHFVCPECAHHQPINTIRPAFQRILGRLRAFALLMVVLVKLNIFFWCLFGWGAFGYEWSYAYQYRPVRVTTAAGAVVNTYRQTPFVPRRFDEVFEDEEVLVGMSLFAVGFGVVGTYRLR